MNIFELGVFMREIKFKVYVDLHRGSIAEYTLQEAINAGYVEVEDNEIVPTFFDDYNVSIVQYVGLKDKNGIEIYEEDTISFDSGYYDGEENWVQCIKTATVGYNKYESPFCFYADVTVTGNKYNLLDSLTK